MHKQAVAFTTPHAFRNRRNWVHFEHFNGSHLFSINSTTCNKIKLHFGSDNWNNKLISYSKKKIIIIQSKATAARVDLIYFLVPVSFSIGFSYMFAVSSAKNAIVFTGGYVKVKDMVRTKTKNQFVFKS